MEKPTLERRSSIEAQVEEAEQMEARQRQAPPPSLVLQPRAVPSRAPVVLDFSTEETFPSPSSVPRSPQSLALQARLEADLPALSLDGSELAARLERAAENR